MARVSILLMALATVIFAAGVYAQDAATPSPAPDAGAGFSLPVSAAFVASSLLLSAFALLKH